VKVVKIADAYCKGCGLCVWVCPIDALAASPDLNPMGIHPVVFKEDAECTGCLSCTAMCPEAAIEIYEVADNEPS
jgi:2-oxoglutarate ferredoxin oxidoreductase subunit delta